MLALSQLILVIFFVFAQSAKEDFCKCSPEYVLVCDKNSLITLKQPCASSCAEFVNPVIPIPEKSNQCREKEEVQSVTRPVHVVSVKYHNCLCVDRKDHTPVCTSEFVTYINECAALCLRNNPTITSQGACPPPQIEHKSCGICYKHYAPVCASNGETFSNECVFECFKKENEVEDITIRHTGKCIDENDSPFVERKNETSNLIPRIGKPVYDNSEEDSKSIEDSEEAEFSVNDLMGDFEKELMKHINYSKKQFVRKKRIDPTRWKRTLCFYESCKKNFRIMSKMHLKPNDFQMKKTEKGKWRVMRGRFKKLKYSKM